MFAYFKQGIEAPLTNMNKKNNKQTSEKYGFKCGR